QLLVQRGQRFGVALHHGVDIGRAVGLAFQVVQRGALLLTLLALGLRILGLLVGVERAGAGAVLGVLVDHHARVLGHVTGHALGQGLLAGGDLVLVDRVEHAKRGAFVRVGIGVHAVVAQGAGGGRVHGRARRLGGRIGRGGGRAGRVVHVVGVV